MSQGVQAAGRRVPATSRGRLAARTGRAGRRERRVGDGNPAAEDRSTGRHGKWFDLYPKAAYMTEIEFWRVCTTVATSNSPIRRLPGADSSLRRRYFRQARRPASTANHPVR